MQLKPLKKIGKLFRKTIRRLKKPYQPFPTINELLHQTRTEAFKQAPKTVRNLVSVGCAGTWYFDWIRETYGDVNKHTGVEFYSPKPNDLPANVEWIANTAGHMPEIAGGSADGIFSGQNMEHLWPEDVCGFYLESHRILQEGGLLIVDSPNRLVTTQYNWSHPEHTVELTPTEAVELTTSAGFDVTNVRGLWLCEAVGRDKLYAFDDMKIYGLDSVKNRMEVAKDFPEKSFLWWVEARRSRRVPDEIKLRTKMTQIWNDAWPERCQRTLTIIGKEMNGRKAFLSRGKPGVLMYGPYLPLRKGRYSAKFSVTLRKDYFNPKDLIRFDIVAGDGTLLLGEREIALEQLTIDQRFEVPFDFEIADTTFGVQFRVIVPSGIVIESDRDVSLQTMTGW